MDWLHGSDRILAVAETIPVSACDCMGTYEASEVRVPRLAHHSKVHTATSKEKILAIARLRIAGRRRHVCETETIAGHPAADLVLMIGEISR